MQKISDEILQFVEDLSSGIGSFIFEEAKDFTSNKRDQEIIMNLTATRTLETILIVLEELKKVDSKTLAERLLK